jgi:hypothetical protein
MQIKEVAYHVVIFENFLVRNVLDKNWWFYKII